nr:MAG TPA: hypothetical protein [Caudoviricetes sp.]
MTCADSLLMQKVLTKRLHRLTRLTQSIAQGKLLERLKHAIYKCVSHCV